MSPPLRSFASRFGISRSATVSSRSVGLSASGVAAGAFAADSLLGLSTLSSGVEGRVPDAVEVEIPQGLFAEPEHRPRLRRRRGPLGIQDGPAAAASNPEMVGADPILGQAPRPPPAYLWAELSRGCLPTCQLPSPTRRAAPRAPRRARAAPPPTCRPPPRSRSPCRRWVGCPASTATAAYRRRS